MQRVSGKGDVFLHATGCDLNYDLAAGGILYANTANLLAFEDSVGYDIGLVKGLLPAWVGGMGMFVAKLEGPGRVVCNSINHSDFAKSLVLPNPKSVNKKQSPESEKKK